MILPSINNFLKILRFYQLNDFKTVKKKISSCSMYTDPSVFYKALDYDYSNTEEGLQYPQDSDALNLSINARIDLSKYFNSAGFPGSYAFNTKDSFRVKSLMLDWASTIKTFQDSTDRINNVYRLSSDEVDKGIRGFGIDFVNSRTLPSLYRRQTFLLNMCELYKIKGSPDSIIKALNIIGLEDIYIQEAWVYPTRDGLRNVEIKWIPVDQGTVFDEQEKKYVPKVEDMETEYWSWGKFNDTISRILECHWFYTKQEILNLEYDKNTFIHLPSLTPYFNVKIRTVAAEQDYALSILKNKLNDQINKYLNGGALNKECSISGFVGNVSLLELWNALLYVHVAYSDYLRYNSFKKFLKKFLNLSLDITNQNDHKYFQLIYSFYTYFNKNPQKQTVLRQTLNLYSETAVPLFDCSYDELKYWWINNPHTEDDDINDLTSVKNIIYPSYIKNVNSLNYVEVFWNEKYPYGYYDVEIYLNGKGWTVVEENTPVKSECMQRLIQTHCDSNYITYDTIEDLYNKIRIVHYRTEDNIPQIFFNAPFNINSKNRDTTLDMIQSFNTNLIHDSILEKSLYHAIFEKQNEDIVSNYTDFDLYMNELDYIKNLQMRLTDRDELYKTYINSLIQYPTSILKEDKQALLRNSFHDYVVKPTYNYIEFDTHDGSNLNHINVSDRYPQNKKWNWAVSYGEKSNQTYMFFNYEANKWCRITSDGLFVDNNISLNTDLFDNEFGVPLYINGNLYIKVCYTDGRKKQDSGCYFGMDKNKSIIEDDWNSLGYTRKSYTYNNILAKFLDECKMKYDIDDGKINVTVPPSDIYPTTCIQKHNYKVDGVKCEFYFCDTMFKPYSRISKEMVVSKIPVNEAKIIYDNVVDCYNENRKDNNENNTIKVTKLFSLTVNPFGVQTESKMEYLKFLRYLYINRYVLDINTGYIYKNFNYYLDQNNYIYIKCVDLTDNDGYCDVVKYRWVRVKCSKQWEWNENRKSIYYVLNNNDEYVLDYDGERISNYFGYRYTPVLSYERVYDSERYLADYVLLDDKYDSVPTSYNKVLQIYNGYKCRVRKDVISSDEVKTTFVEEKNLEKYVDGNKVQQIKNKIPLLNVVNFGLNQDLLDYINTKILKFNDSGDQYSDLIILLSDALNDYITKYYGVKSKLDVYNHQIFKNRLINNIIKFYKPKRDRMLELNSSVEIDDVDSVIGDGISDFEYNHVDKNYTDTLEENINKTEIGLYNNKALIKQEINDYVPFDDLVFLDKNNIDTTVHSYREIYPKENEIPLIEYYNSLDQFKNYILNINQKDLIPKFYVSDCIDKYSGYYYEQEDGNYYLGDYVFCKKHYVIKSHWYKDEFGIVSKHTDSKYVSIDCWCVVSKINMESQDPLKCIYVSLDNPSETPWLDSDGDALKYRYVQKKISTEDDFVEQYYTKRSEFTDLIFQVYSEDNLIVKTNLKYIEPLFYIANCSDYKYNGYYYPTSERFSMPVYTNKHGKMISYFDLSYLPDYYVDFNISCYSENKSRKFWIITDYKEIPDISDATYIAYDDNSNIFDEDRVQTKTFFPCYPKLDKYNNDYIYLHGIYGFNVNELSEHPEYLNKLDVVNVKYDNSEKYEKLLSRRVSQNIIPEKYTPISYINFYFEYGLTDTVGKNVVSINYKDNRNNENIYLYKNRYTLDDNGYEYGALYVSKDTTLTVVDNSNHDTKTIVFKAKNIKSNVISLVDDEWHTYTIVKNNSECKLYVDKKYNSNVRYSNILQITGDDCSICEYAIFDMELPEWYIKIISEYGVFRYRRETCTDKDYVIKDIPNSYHGKWMYGLPPRSQGDRISSKCVDYVGDVYFKPYDPKDPFGSYKWNVLSRYYPENPCEISSLWSTKTSGRIYDRMIVPKYNLEGKIIGVSLDVYGKREYTKPTVKYNGHENYYREYDKSFFIDGVEFSVPNNYCVDGEIPIWYTKDPSTYKTGDITHNPVNINVIQKIDDPYPFVHHGEKYISYFDYEHLLDGIQSGNNLLYTTEHYDENTNYLDCRNEFYTEDEFYEKYGKNIHTYNVTVTEGHANGLECSLYDFINTNIFFDPNIVHITKDMKENCIYHTEIKLHEIDGVDKNLIGNYHFNPTVPLRKSDDFEYCYSRIVQTKNLAKFMDIIHGLKESKWSDSNNPDTIELYQQYIVVPVYHEKSNHYYWEIRKLVFKLLNPSIEIKKTDKNYIEETIIEGNGYKYNFYVEMNEIYHTYINDRKVQWVDDKENYINQYQLDICGQRICKYNESITDFLENNYRDYFNQEVVNDFVFVNYDTIKLNFSNINKFDNDHFGYHDGVYYYDGKGLYVNVDQNWYGPYNVNKNEVLPKQLSMMVCNIDAVYINSVNDKTRKCYFKVQDGQWVCVTDFGVGYMNNNTMYKPFKLENRKNVFINLPKTDKELPYWSYYVDVNNIMTTLRRFKELYEVGSDSKGNELGIGFVNKQTITDLAWIYVCYVCKFPNKILSFCKQ